MVWHTGNKIRELSDGSSLSIVYDGVCGRLVAIHSTFMYWIGWNDKLCADTTHRLTAATVAAAHVAIARIEVQVPSAVRGRSAERRTPNVAVAAYIVN